MKKSKKYALNKEDLKSLLIGLLITLAGAGLTYIADNLSKVDFGQYTVFIVPVAALLVNAARKFITGR